MKIILLKLYKKIFIEIKKSVIFNDTRTRLQTLKIRN